MAWEEQTKPVSEEDLKFLSNFPLALFSIYERRGDIFFVCDFYVIWKISFCSLLWYEFPLTFLHVLMISTVSQNAEKKYRAII